MNNFKELVVTDWKSLAELNNQNIALKYNQPTHFGKPRKDFNLYKYDNLEICLYKNELYYVMVKLEEKINQDLIKNQDLLNLSKSEFKKFLDERDIVWKDEPKYLIPNEQSGMIVQGKDEIIFDHYDKLYSITLRP